MCFYFALSKSIAIIELLIINFNKKIMNYKLKNKETGEEIGLINEEQLQFLNKELEEESLTDKDYWLHRSLLITFRENGADNVLLNILENAFGNDDELEISWEEA